MNEATKIALRPAFKAVAERIAAGEDAMIGHIAKFGGISREAAVKVFNAYRKAKVLKRQSGDYSLRVSHGTFLNKETILHVLKNL